MKLFSILFLTILTKVELTPFTSVGMESDEDDLSATCDIGTAQRIPLLQQPDGPSVSGINFRQRHRVKACGRTPFYPLNQNDRPINFGASDGSRGKGSFPYWGPNILTQLGFVKSSGLDLYYLAVRSNGTVFLQNLAPSAEQGFEAEEMKKFLRLAVEQATAALIKEGVDAESAGQQIFDELQRYSKIVLAGSIPWHLNTNNAWLEVQTKLINCHKKSTLCKYGIEKLASDMGIPWLRINKSGKQDVTMATKKPSLTNIVTVNDVEKYSAFCHMKKEAEFMAKIRKGAVTVPMALGMVILVPLGLVLAIAATVVYIIIKIAYAIVLYLVRALRCVLGM